MKNNKNLKDNDVFWWICVTIGLIVPLISSIVMFFWVKSL